MLEYKIKANSSKTSYDYLKYDVNSILLSDNYSKLTGNVLSLNGISDNDVVEVKTELYRNSKPLKISISGETFTLETKTNEKLTINKLKAINSIDYLVYTIDEKLPIFYSGFTDYLTSEISDGTPYVFIDGVLTHFELTDELYPKADISGQTYDIIRNDIYGNYGVRMSLEGTNLTPYNIGDYINVYSLNEDSSIYGVSSSAITHLGFDYPIIPNLKYTTMVNGREIEIVIDINGGVAYSVEDSKIKFKIINGLLFRKVTTRGSQFINKYSEIKSWSGVTINNKNYYVENKYAQIPSSGLSFTSTEPISSITSGLTSFVYQDGYYVGVTGANLYVSKDRIDWDIIEIGSGVTNQKAICYFGKDINNYSVFISIGSDGYSVTHRLDVDGFVNNTIQDIESTNDFFAISTDGQRVIAISSGLTIYNTPSVIENWFETYTNLEEQTDIVYGNGVFIVISNSGKLAILYQKSDNWIQYDLPKDNKNYTMHWSKISYGDGKFVIVSNAGDVDSPKSAYSVNGTNWINNDLIFKAKLITYGDGYFMCIDTNTSTTQIAYSNNGINWGYSNISNYKNIKSLIFNGEYFVMSNSDGSFSNSQTFILGKTLTINDNLVGRLIVDGKTSKNNLTCSVLLDSKYSSQYDIINFETSLKVIDYIMSNKQSVSFYIINTIFGNPFFTEEYNLNAVKHSLSISKRNTGFEIPLFFNNDMATNMNQEDLISRYYADSVKNELLTKTENRIVDMERDIYTPGFLRKNKSLTNPSLYGVQFNNYEDVDEIRFNLHFRTRNLDTWKVIEDDKSNQSINKCNWFVTDYYNPKNMLPTLNNGKLNPLFYTKLDSGLYKSSDLLYFLGFDEEDVKFQKDKLAKSFLRLSFYDSPDIKTQNLLFYSTIFMNENVLYGEYLRNMKVKKDFLSIEDGINGYFDNKIGLNFTDIAWVSGESQVRVTAPTKTLDLVNVGDEIEFKITLSTEINTFTGTVQSKETGRFVVLTEYTTTAIQIAENKNKLNIFNKTNIQYVKILGKLVVTGINQVTDSADGDTIIMFNDTMNQLEIDNYVLLQTSSTDGTKQNVYGRVLTTNNKLSVIIDSRDSLNVNDVVHICELETPFFDNQLKVSNEEYRKYIYYDKDSVNGVGKSKSTFCPSLDENNRLSSRITVKGRNMLNESSDGFYLYLFKEFSRSLHPRTIYMKVEFNHAGYGQKVPFMRLTKKQGSMTYELNKISQINNKIKSGYEIDEIYENMFIPIKIVYDDVKKRFTYYYENNFTNKLEFNLFEVKYKAIESVSPTITDSYLKLYTNERDSYEMEVTSTNSDLNKFMLDSTSKWSISNKPDWVEDVYYKNGLNNEIYIYGITQPNMPQTTFYIWVNSYSGTGDRTGIIEFINEEGDIAKLNLIQKAVDNNLYLWGDNKYTSPSGLVYLSPLAANSKTTYLTNKNKESVNSFSINSISGNTDDITYSIQNNNIVFAAHNQNESSANTKTRLFEIYTEGYTPITCNVIQQVRPNFILYEKQNKRVERDTTGTGMTGPSRAPSSIPIDANSEYIEIAGNKGYITPDSGKTYNTFYIESNSMTYIQSECDWITVGSQNYDESKSIGLSSTDGIKRNIFIHIKPKPSGAGIRVGTVKFQNYYGNALKTIRLSFRQNDENSTLIPNTNL